MHACRRHQALLNLFMPQSFFWQELAIQVPTLYVASQLHLGTKQNYYTFKSSCGSLRLCQWDQQVTWINIFDLVLTLVHCSCSYVCTSTMYSIFSMQLLKIISLLNFFKPHKCKLQILNLNSPNQTPLCMVTIQITMQLASYWLIFKRLKACIYVLAYQQSVYQLSLIQYLYNYLATS